LDAALLLQRASGLSRALQQAWPERELDAGSRARFAAEATRRAAGEPFAYIEGRKEFWSLPLQVSPAVLVPRPETELLVETALAELPTGPLQLADLGTGSGAIALALANERPAWSVWAVDASMRALSVAQANALRLGLAQLHFRHGRWCAPLPAGRLFEAIVANPPYIDAADPALAALGHEPRSALVAGDGGFADLLQVASEARAHLRPGGLLLLEHGATQAPRLAVELVARGYARVVCRRDLAGHDRLTAARWPGP
jgi:release factor glutamine methyltransferase